MSRRLWTDDIMRQDGSGIGEATAVVTSSNGRRNRRGRCAPRDGRRRPDSKIHWKRRRVLFVFSFLCDNF